jgi:TolA-binding protein
MSKKELKEPDAFMKVGSKARGWLQDNVRLVVIASAVALVGIGGAVTVDLVGERGEDAASKDLGERLKALERPVSETATTTGEDAPFKSVQERDEAVAKAMAELRAARGGTKAARTAALVLAGAQLRLKKYDEALTGFADYLKETHPEGPLRAAAMEGQGYAHEGKGDLEKALASFGLYHRGRILALQNKKEDAARAFNDVSSAHPGTEAAKLALARLNELKAQGVVLPEPVAPAGAAADGGGGQDAG